MSDQLIRAHYWPRNTNLSVDDHRQKALVSLCLMREQQAAQLAVIQAGQRIIDVIRADLTLTDQCQEKQINIVKQHVDNFKLALYRCETMSEVQKTGQQAVLSIAQQHHSGLPLSLQKEQARLAINKTSQPILLAINNDVNLTPALQDQQQEKVHVEVRKAHQIVNQAKNAQQIANGKNMGLFKIKHQYQPLVSSLESNELGFPKAVRIEQWRTELKRFFEKQN